MLTELQKAILLAILFREEEWVSGLRIQELVNEPRMRHIHEAGRVLQKQGLAVSRLHHVRTSRWGTTNVKEYKITDKGQEETNALLKWGKQ